MRIVLIALMTLVGTTQAAEPPVRLVDAATQKAFQSLLPKTSSDWFEELKDEGMVFYTDASMPRAYQIWSGGLQGIHSPSYNISAGAGEPFGNPNREFPWGHPAGTDEAATIRKLGEVRSFRFAVFPKKDGEIQPITWWRGRLPRDTAAEGSFQWSYPTGMVFGEVLTLHGPDDGDATFEVRTRQKTKDGKWRVDVFRPFPTKASLLKRLDELKDDAVVRADAKRVAALRQHLQDEQPLNRYHLRNRQTSEVIDRLAHIDYLPPISPAVTQKLLETTTFTSALGQEWSSAVDTKGRRYECHAPSTTDRYHIVPHEYSAAFIRVDSKSCMACHSTCSMHADDFEDIITTGRARDWYGRVRGSDAIFSFHIFHPSCISASGTPLPVRLNDRLVSAGLLRRRD